nr:histidine kinase [Kineosporia babensis]
MAQEMHDVLNHSVGLIALQAGGALHVFDRDERAALSALQNISTLAGTSAKELRESVRRLQDPQGREGQFARQGIQDIPELVKLARAAGRDLALDLGSATWHPDPDRQQVVYRFVQEGVTNAFRHGRHGSVIRISVFWGEASLLAEVENEVDPRREGGEPERAGGSGLPGLQRRVLSVGGVFEVFPGHGRFMIRMRIDDPSRA